MFGFLPIFIGRFFFANRTRTCPKALCKDLGAEQGEHWTSSMPWLFDLPSGSLT
jgi:hypothetical protein